MSVDVKEMSDKLKAVVLGPHEEIKETSKLLDELLERVWRNGEPYDAVDGHHLDYDQFVAHYEKVARDPRVPKRTMKELNMDMFHFRLALENFSDTGVGVWICHFRMVIAYMGYKVDDQILLSVYTVGDFYALLEKEACELLISKYCQAINFAKEKPKVPKIRALRKCKRVILENEETCRVLTVGDYELYRAFVRPRDTGKWSAELHISAACECHFKIHEKHRKLAQNYKKLRDMVEFCNEVPPYGTGWGKKNMVTRRSKDRGSHIQGDYNWLYSTNQ